MFSRKSMSLIAVLGLLIFSVYATAGPNANAVLSLDLIADGGAGNGTDDRVTSGTVSGRGTTIAIEIFATGVRTSLIGVTLEFDFDSSLLSFVKAENSAFSLTLPEGLDRHPLCDAQPGHVGIVRFSGPRGVRDGFGRNGPGVFHWDRVGHARREHDLERRTHNHERDHVQRLAFSGLRRR